VSKASEEDLRLRRSRAARTGALIIARPERETLVVSGSDRASWLNGLVTCDVGKLTAGEGAWGLLLTQQGKIVSDLDVVAGEAELFLGATAGTGLKSALERFLIMEDAELQDRSSDLAWITVHGPKASALIGSEPPPGAPIDWTGLGGAALLVARDALDQRIQALAAREGAEVGTADDFEVLSIERGLPRYGTDYDSRDNPHDASLERRAVSWTKGCYLGQEVVCMQDMRGKLKRRVVALALEGDELPARGTPVESAGGSAGEITSAAWSALTDGVVALARIRAAAMAPESKLAVAGRSAWPLDPPP
jgi:tRNA-modifying protein YgfZ